MAKERGIMKMIFNNFMKSIKRRTPSGNMVGKDQFGNQFFEIPADRSIGRSKASRWFVPQQKDDFMKEMPAEWEAWLRGRRDQAPTADEVMRNVAIAELTKENAAKLDAERPKPPLPLPDENMKKPYPKYDEYFVVPGEGDHPPKKP